MTTATPSTRAEDRIADRYARVLDLVSRCAQAVDRGDWFYLQDKAADLVGAAGELVEAAVAGDKATPQPRAEAVRAAVLRYGRNYPATRLLHPATERP